MNTICQKFEVDIKTSTFIQLLTGLVFLILGVVLVLFVVREVQNNAMRAAQEKAEIILYHNLATHLYFTHQLKPAVFELSGANLEEGYFDPRWMSSNYAVREIGKNFQELADFTGYYYKEAAINARSLENEADPYEREFINALNQDRQLQSDSSVQMIAGQPYFTTLVRGEVMQTTCLECHSQPEIAPDGLVQIYGGDRSFDREIGEIASAISIRIPLASVLRGTDRLTFGLSALLLGALLSLLLFSYWLNRRLFYNPLNAIRQKAQQIAEGREKIGEQMAVPFGRELADLTQAFNSMSASLRQERDQLEERVAERTDEIRKQKEYYEALVKNNPIAIVSLDMDQRVVSVNPAFEQLFGYVEGEVVRKKLDQMIVVDDKQEEANGYTDRVLEGETIFITGKRRMKNGKQVEVEIYGVPVVQGDDRIGVLGLYNDISERKQAEKALRESEDRFRGFFESAIVGMVIADVEGRFTQVNRAMCDMVGYSKQELLKMSFSDITHPDDQDFDLYYFSQLLRGEIESFQIEKRYLHKNGEQVWVTLSATVMRNVDGEPNYIIGQVQDITPRRQTEERLQYMATHDLLTKLPNRSLFYDRLGHALQLARREMKRVAVLFLDLDGFKEVNDTFGHEKGDLLLQLVASRLETNLRGSDTVARLGGDEFAFVFENIKGSKDAEAAASRILASLVNPFSLNGSSYAITGSIGISLSPGDGDNAESLVQNADAAMYHAKDVGKNNFQFYDESIPKNYRQRSGLLEK
jgi:diguanylate cyclase (GGDEF)-like protein/PAS domain S-box-containing protein